MRTSARTSACHVHYFHSGERKGQVRLRHVQITRTGGHWLGATTVSAIAYIADTDVFLIGALLVMDVGDKIEHKKKKNTKKIQAAFQAVFMHHV